MGGDCDNDSHCLPGLVCGKDNCVGSAFKSTDDCCMEVECNGGIPSCCTEDNQCGINEGDCDNDSHCLPGLVCGKNNCVGSAFKSTDDCCMEGSGCNGGIPSCCTEDNQ